MQEFVGKTVTDIVLVGASYEEEEKIAQVSLNLEYFFVEINSEVWIRLKTEDQMSRLDVKSVDELTFDYEIDEDDKYTSISIMDFIWIDTISVLTFSNIKQFFHEGKLKAVELVVGDIQSIFIDATYYTGLKVGSNNLKQIFLDNHEGATVVSCIE